MALQLTGCVYALHPYNKPGPEKLHLVSEKAGRYSVRIDGHGDTAVGTDGRVVLNVPGLRRGCSVYLFGVMKVGNGSPERIKAINVLRNGKVVRRLSLETLHRLPVDEDGYRILKL
jgi:hypothetical protein